MKRLVPIHIFQLLVTLSVLGCGVMGGLSEIGAPDRFGIGTSKGTGAFGGSMETFAPGLGLTEAGRIDGTLDDLVMANAWVEWDLPSFNGGGRTSFAGMRNRFMDDFKPKSEGFVTVTQVVDEETGAVTYEFGATEALTGAIGTLLTFLGYRVIQKKRNGNGNEKK